LVKKRELARFQVVIIVRRDLGKLEARIGTGTGPF
jgi:hypothetical protein